MFNKKNKAVVEEPQTMAQQDELDFDLEDTDEEISMDTFAEEQPLSEESFEPEEYYSYEEEEQSSESFEQEQEVKEQTSTKENDKLQDIVLHIVIDKSPSDMLDYFRGYGVNVSRIFNDIEEAKNEVLMQINPCRLVIVDTGTGRFSVMGSRKALIDLLGIGDEDNKISVFYTDRVIKEDISLAEEVDNKQIDWIKYRSTADILATLLQKKKKENYIIDDTLTEAKRTTDIKELMHFKGLNMVAESIDLGQPTISVTDIIMNRDGENNQLQAYEVKY